MKELLKEALREITNLRRENEIMRAQIGIVHVFAAALGLQKDQSGMSPDVAWALQEKINSIENGAI